MADMPHIARAVFLIKREIERGSDTDNAIGWHLFHDRDNRPLLIEEAKRNGIVLKKDELAAELPDPVSLEMLDRTFLKIVLRQQVEQALATPVVLPQHQY